MVAQPPDVRFRSCEPRAVDARLLACAQADDSPVFSVRDAVRLRVLDRQCSDDEVSHCLLRELREG